MKTNNKKNALVMCECAIMIALAAVLSFVKILELPYMIPETIINAAAVFWLFGCLNFRSEKISVAKKIEKNLTETVSASISILSLMVAVIIDAVAVFASLQNPDSGVLDFSLISNTNFTLVGIVSAIGIVLCVVFAIIAKVTSNSAKKVN